MSGAQTFYDVLKERASGESDPMRKLSWSRFETLGLPTRKTETYRYVKLRHLFATNPVAATSSTIELKHDAHVVFVDGYYKPELSNLAFEGLQIKPLSEAKRTYASFLKNRSQKVIETEKDSFAALNSALHSEGVFLYLAPKAVLKTPLKILHVVSGESPFVMPRMHLFAGAASQIKIECLTNAKEAINGYVDLHLEPAANVKLTYQTEGSPNWHFESLRAALKKDANLDIVHVTEGSLATRYDYNIDLLEPGSTVSLSGLATLDEKREAHSNVLITHHAPSCTSNQLFKNIVSGNGHSSFEGKIYVHKEAQQTEAYQLNANLLLNEGAKAESKPNLEIFADDVRASHGATFGKLEEDEIFYLKTRGLTSQQAEKALIRGFAQEILDKLN